MNVNDLVTAWRAAKNAQNFACTPESIKAADKRVAQLQEIYDAIRESMQVKTRH